MTTEEKVANDLQGKGDVKLKVGKIRFRLRKLRLGTIIQMSGHIAGMAEVNPELSMYQNLFNNPNSVKITSRIAALALLDSWLLNWLSRPLAWYVRWNLSMEELADLMKVIADNMGAKDFFFIMTLTKGMNFLRKTEAESEAAKPSTEG